MTPPASSRSGPQPFQSPIGVLFVCLGNICRSPLAEGVFVHLARQRGVLERFRVDSCGTGDWHSGELADPRSRAVARKHGIELTHRARVLSPDDDFQPAPWGRGFHWLIGMDRQNCRRMTALGAPPERVRLLRSFDPLLAGRSEAELEVPDPYSEPDEAFDEVYAMVERACAGMLDELLKESRGA
ncbi:MAG: low molecular weight protein-tyrosine-phosphatase [Phycisphaerales bacterium]